MKLKYFSLGDKTVQLCMSGTLDIVEVAATSQTSVMAKD